MPSPALAGEPAALPRSVWLETAAPAPSMPPLAGEVEADVLVVGAGFTGLAAAVHLAEQGARVVVLEAVEPGWGASGRNNGQVIPGLKLDPDDLERTFGRERGARLAAWGGSAPDRVFELIERYGIPCHPVRTGWIQPAYTARSVAQVESRCAQWAARGAPVDLLPHADLERMLGTGAFLAAWIDRRGGTINPLGFARGLAVAAMRAGAAAHAHSPVQSLERAGKGWVARTARGAVRAAKVLVATAAYADDLVPGLRRSFVPVRTAQTASVPLPAHMAAAILPGRQGASDTRRLLTSFRLSPDGRLVMGGSGATGGLSHEHLLPRLRRAGAELFRALGPVEWAFGWSGYFAVTSEHLPRLHESGDGIVCALGCNGRGIAVSTALGRLAAERLLGRDDRDAPLRPTPMRSVPFYAFRHIGIAVATTAGAARDRYDRLRSAAAP